jgi:hypothetical protein
LAPEVGVELDSPVCAIPGIGAILRLDTRTPQQEGSLGCFISQVSLTNREFPFAWEPLESLTNREFPFAWEPPVMGGTLTDAASVRRKFMPKVNRICVNGSAASPQRKPSLAERVEQADAELSTRYNALNQLFSIVEQRLKSLKPLQPVWHIYAHERIEGQVEEWELLGLTLYQGKWRLCHGHDHELNAEGPILDIKPIIECPVDIRVRASQVVRQLHEKIVQSKEEYIPQVDQAIKELTDFCNDC